MHSSGCLVICEVYGRIFGELDKSIGVEIQIKKIITTLSLNTPYPKQSIPPWDEAVAVGLSKGALKWRVRLGVGQICQQQNQVYTTNSHFE